MDSWISTAKCCFPVNQRYKIENLNKIWKFENQRWRPPVTSFIWLLLPWKPIGHHVVWLNWKYKWSLLYVPNFKSIGWIVSKVEGWGGPIAPPPPSRLRVTIFSRRLLRLNELVRRKIQLRKVMGYFGNNNAPFLANKTCFRCGLRCIFESHWVSEFFNTIVYFKSNTVKEIEINCILWPCSVIVIWPKEYRFSHQHRHFMKLYSQ